ncbi:hypothetical protein C8R45DRAFT_362942 [Mycena sanguinolenta]|nr:hypothetical protein C8R45DRAFT_362942 [Mycena sanguinolenta]
MLPFVAFLLPLNPFPFVSASARALARRARRIHQDAEAKDAVGPHGVQPVMVVGVNSVGGKEVREQAGGGVILQNLAQRISKPEK